MASFRMSDELNCTVSGWGWWAVGCGKISALTAPNIAQGDYAGLSWQGHRISAVQMLIRSKARFSSYKFRNSN
uniref:Secreted protein n=1 Tax=Syphacia muris TaxID=451379 RepID=A0A0N5AW82_9BILA